MTVVNVRIATEEDIVELTRMALLFKASSPYSDLPVEEEKVDFLIKKLLRDDKDCSIVLIAEKGSVVIGMIAGTSAEFLWNTQRQAAELVWWVDPPHRKSKAGPLLKGAFEYWAKNVAGCSHVCMSALDERLKKHYIKSGYVPMEHSLLKALDG